MLLTQPGRPLMMSELSVPEPAADEVLIRVSACGVCRTDLHIVDGELPAHKLPLVPGHEIVGVIERPGANTDFSRGDRVGVPWLATTCGVCDACRSGRENLCDAARFTGYDVDGGYARYTIAHKDSVLRVDEKLDAAQTAPLLCAGLIGFRSLRLAGDAARLGLYGFGAAAHIVAQIAARQGREVYAFTRPGDRAGQQFALSLGAHWAGDSDGHPPQALDAAIIYAPAGELVPAALQAVRKGGVVICAGIHMSDIPAFPYRILWGERVVRSVANLTRQDGREFMELAAKVPLRTHVETYPLAAANEALSNLRSGKVQGAAVLMMDDR
jgi:propanol-preferring alcohol dehydrogenase